MINKAIFKSYDIRGIYPTELNKEAAYQIGKAFIAFTGAKRVAIGHDARLSSPELHTALTEGIISQGADVYTIGQVPTECVYFAIMHLDVDAAMMITASHNPKEYNGIKMMKKAGNDIIWVRGKDLLTGIEKDVPDAPEKGAMREADIWDDYINHISTFLGEMKPLKVVVDASNGVIGKAITKIKEKLPVEILELNFEPDGNFPNHSPNPLEEGSCDQIAKKIKAEKADFGFMFDADADRIFLVDEKGAIVPGDTTLLLLAKHFLQKNPGMGISYNAICSRTVPEFVKQWGGVPVRTAVGFVNVRQGLIDHNGIMGGEPSCHYCFRDYFYMDSGMVAFLTLLQIISRDGRPVSEIIKELSPYASASINFEVTDKEAILNAIKEKYADGKQDYLDGVTVEYSDWWFNVRPSNTEPLLRLTIEADTLDLLESKKKELSELIQT
ncbi:MAG: phosphomannomutase/phosphoglucomutase [bacterium]|nr:phosphomannomutase/phosphoglucomutase [bacterium]